MSDKISRNRVCISFLTCSEELENKLWNKVLFHGKLSWTWNDRELAFGEGSKRENKSLLEDQVSIHNLDNAQGNKYLNYSAGFYPLQAKRCVLKQAE